jgi:hypothetical protein
MNNFKHVLDNIDHQIIDESEVQRLKKYAQNIKEENKSFLDLNKTEINSIEKQTPKSNDVMKTGTSGIDTKTALQSYFFNARQNLTKFNSPDKNQNKEKKEDNTPLITIKNILNDTKHYEIRFVKIAKVLLIFGFILFVLLSVFNILTSITNFESLYNIHNVSKSFMPSFSLVIELFNHVRLSIFYNDKSANVDDYYNNILNELDLSNLNKTEFINIYSSYMPLTYNYLLKINNKIDDNNKDVLCPISTVCELNSKGITDGYNSALRQITLMYKDFVLKDTNKPRIEDVLGFFNNSDYKILDIELNDVFLLVNNAMFNSVINDTDTIVGNIQLTIVILGIVSLLFSVMIVLYVFLVFLSKMKFYLNFIIYSGNKYNKAIYNDK